MRSTNVILLLLSSLLLVGTTDATSASIPKRKARRGLVKGSSTAATRSRSRALQATTEDNTPDLNNIFDHVDSIDTTPVQCGTEESPFLTTFVTSFQFRRHGGGGSSSSSKSKSNKSHNKSTTTSSKSGKSSSGKSGKTGSAKSGSSSTKSGSSSTKSSRSSGGKGKGGSGKSGNNSGGDSGDGYYTDGVAELSQAEQRALEGLFRDVYNGYSFTTCDGFFRTVYTVSMTLVERQTRDDTADADDTDAEEDYAVSLARTYKTVTIPGGRRLQEEEEEDSHDGDIMMPDESSGDPALYGNNETEVMGRQSGGFWGSPQNYDEEDEDEDDSTSTTTTTSTSSSTANWNTNVQQVTGSATKTIYYVSFTATCRNCEVTPEVNFPLLMIPSAEAEANMAAATADPTLIAAPMSEECTCPANSIEEERRRLQQSSSNNRDDDDLFRPPPAGPTADELIALMNAAIAEDDILNNRLEGIDQLMEPDYFEGENPELVDDNAPSAVPTADAPTRAPLTRRPTLAPDRNLPSAAMSYRGDRLAVSSLVVVVASTAMLLLLGL